MKLPEKWPPSKTPATGTVRLTEEERGQVARCIPHNRLNIIQNIIAVVLNHGYDLTGKTITASEDYSVISWMEGE